MSALTTLLQRRSHSTTMHSGIATSRLARAAQLRGYSGCLLLIYFSLRHKGEKDEDDEIDLTILNHRFNFISFFWLPRTMGDKEVERIDFLFSCHTHHCYFSIPALLLSVLLSSFLSSLPLFLCLHSF